MDLDRLFYEYRVVGFIEKDGKRYKKYQKVPRIRRRHIQGSFFLFLAFAASVIVLRVIFGLSSSVPSAPTDGMAAGSPE